MKDNMLSPVSGFYFLTPEGALGYYDDHGQWIPDADLNELFGGFNREFIQSYLREPDAGMENGPVRVAVICTPTERKKWNSATLILETPALKGLFRVIGAKPNDALTEFQKRNREMSAFRGMELLLEYRMETYPGMPIYCPVLFDRNTTLDRYAAAFGRAPVEADAVTPVIEVLNLLAAIPMKGRNTTAVSELTRRIHQRTINKQVRSGPGFTVAGDVAGEYCPVDSLTNKVDPIFVSPEPLAPVMAVRQPARNVPPRAPGFVEQGPPPVVGAAPIEKLMQPVAEELLRQFEPLRELDKHQLTILASYCRLYRAIPGARLLKRGSQDDMTIYLVQGEVELKAADGARRIVAAGTPEACRPIAQLKPRLYRVKARSHVVFLQMKDASLVQVLRETSTGSGDDGDTTTQVGSAT